MDEGAFCEKWGLSDLLSPESIDRLLKRGWGVYIEGTPSRCPRRPSAVEVELKHDVAGIIAVGHGRTTIEALKQAVESI